jgi:hypothetical protein
MIRLVIIREDPFRQLGHRLGEHRIVAVRSFRELEILRDRVRKREE